MRRSAKQETFAEKTLRFYEDLSAPAGLPKGIEVMNPYAVSPTRELVAAFMRKYFSDTRPRILMIGINPGRLGGGATGVHFTDPKRLRDECGIDNDLPPTHETSSAFVYEMITAYGGPQKFYGDVFLTAASPLGLTKNGVNYNYYDDPKTAAALKPFIARSIQAYIDMGGRRDKAIILGTGKNFQFLSKLNDEYHFFDTLIPVEHPRFVMQYRSKRKAEYIQKYLDAIRGI